MEEILKPYSPAKLLIIPGLGGSDHTHWQSLWHCKYKDSIQLVQDNWDKPSLIDWLDKLTINVSYFTESFLFVAHSLGVALVAHWANQNRNNLIKGALLVAPADVDFRQYTPDVVRSFAPMPLAPLPFPSLIVASRNDPYVSIKRAIHFSCYWKSNFVDIGVKGHINAESGLGEWQEGQTLLQQLQQQSDTFNGRF